MRITTAKLAAVLGSVALFFTAGAAWSANAKNEEQQITNAKVSLSQAVEKAEAQGNGKAIGAEFSSHSGTAGAYEVKVLSNDGKKLTKYYLDPDSGRVTKTANESVEKAFTRLKPEAIANAPTSLTQAISTAEERASGKAIDASVDRGGDQVVYTVKVAKADGSTEKLKINGANGRVASAK